MIISSALSSHAQVLAIITLAGALAVAQEPAALPTTVSAPAFDPAAADLCGDYCASQHLNGYTLSLLADRVFHQEWRGCLGVYGQCDGHYRVEDGLVILTPNGGMMPLMGGSRFVPLKWDRRLYLIPEADVRRFRNDVLRGAQPQSWPTAWEYLRRGDEYKMVAVPPVVPQRWRAVFAEIAGKQIEATVTGVHARTWESNGQPVVENYATVNAGTRDGMQSGMYLRIDNGLGPVPSDLDQRILLQAGNVSDDSTEARILPVTPNGDRPSRGVEVGDRAVAIVWTDASERASPKLTREQIAARDAAQALMRQMIRTYATCKSYADEGVVTSVFANAGGTKTYERPFTTRFVRPARFRFEYRATTPTGESPQGIVWGDGTSVREWSWYMTSSSERQGADLFGALAGLAGTSTGASVRIPALLLPKEDHALRIANLKELEVLGEETIDGVPCTKLRGLQPHDDSTLLLWIDNGQKLLRKVFEPRQIGVTRVETTTTYKPRVDVEVPSDELTFHPPD
jgi:hypothetical protein